MPRHNPMIHTEPEDLITPASAPSPGAAAAEDQPKEARHTRRRVATVEIPEEIHALSALTGVDSAQLIEIFLADQVASVRKSAANILNGAT